jgi:radical SAM protein with 4Fe4S-binding SPASM domain
MKRSRIADSINLLTKLTPRKVINALKILWSYYLSRILFKTSIKGLPISLSIEPTTACNLRCPECPSGLRSFSRPTGMLSKDIYQKIIDELHPNLVYLTLYFQGEPYLHPDFHDLVSYASIRNIYTSTSTNAHFLDKETARDTVRSGLDRLIISIDGATQETYAAYRKGGKLEKVISGTKNIVEAKQELKSSTPHLIFQFLVVKPNEHQIHAVRELAKKVGIDEVRFKTAQIYDYSHGSELIPAQEKYSRYRKTKEGTYVIKNPLENHCWKMWHSSVITWDGKVVPCCFDKDASHNFGSIGNQSFSEIWQCEAYENFRSLLRKGRKEIDICRNCSEGKGVWA